MQIEHKKGEVLGDPEIKIVLLPTNCVGIMSAGLAMNIKRQYRQMFEKYKNYCRDGKMIPGGLFWSRERHCITGDPLVLALIGGRVHQSAPLNEGFLVNGLSRVNNLLEKEVISGLVGVQLYGAGLRGFSVDRYIQVLRENLPRAGGIRLFSSKERSFSEPVGILRGIPRLQEVGGEIEADFSE